MSDLEKRMQHREFVHNTITRMNSNSFQIKGLTITIVAAFLAIYGSNSKDLFLIIPIPFVILFWLLDTYYLQQEKKYREMYNEICDLNSTPCTLQVYSMNTSNYNGKNLEYKNIFINKTIYSVYLTIILSLLITYFIFQNISCCK